MFGRETQFITGHSSYRERELTSYPCLLGEALKRYFCFWGIRVMSKPHIQFFKLQSSRWQLVEVDTLLVPLSIEEAEVLVTSLKTQVPSYKRPGECRSQALDPVICTWRPPFPSL